ncbi:MAG: glucose-6-phosphate isomerase [Pseudomonadota bacterium]
MLASALPEWQALTAHRDSLARRHLNDLFAADSQRFDRLSLRFDDFLLDFSKQRVTPETLALLVKLAEKRGLREFLADMAAGKAVNATENRAALHIALRAQGGYAVGGRDVTAEVQDTLSRMRAFVARLRAGEMTGATGKPLATVVNLGIGGSDLGPRMAAAALSPWASAAVDVRFVANIDPAEFAAVTAGLDPARTLFIVASKTFTTSETLANARAAREWLAAAGIAREAAGAHFAAVSNNLAAAQSLGIAPERCFPLPEWAGGRYSLWSAIGLPLACAVGMDRFEEMLAGARDMDRHFLEAPFAHNLPVAMALIGLWNSDFLDAPTLAVLPYCHRLAWLPAYLQQLEMESNGKRITLDGEPVDYPTSPVVWGMPGTVGQHAFHQLFYQGTRTVPCDFIVPLRASAGEGTPLPENATESQQALVANALAQSAALMRGRDVETARRQLLAAGRSADDARRLAPHLECPGNQPSSTLMFPELTPRSLGRLIALYEHKVAVQGCLWGVNSFDQFGVELGKQMAREILPQMLGGAAGFDSSTAGLLAYAQNAFSKGTTP